MHTRQTSSAIDEIMVVDDTLMSLNLLTEILKEAGYRVRPAVNGHIALRSLAVRLPSLILLDVKMPHMDGYTLCRRLKADPNTADIPVIFISALEETEDKVKGFDAGGVDFITKPFQMREVLARIDTHLRLRRLQHELNIARRKVEAKVRQRTAELEQANAALIESKAQFKAIFDNMQDGYLYADMEGSILLVNPATVQMLGYDAPEQLIGRDITTSVYADSGQRMALKSALMEHHEVKGYEVLFKYRNGRTFPAELSTHLVFDDRQQPVAIESLFRDISHRKAAEEKLRESRARYRAVVEDIPAVVCRFLPDGRTTFYNEEFCNFCGFNADACDKYNFFECFPMEQPEEIKNRLESICQTTPLVIDDLKISHKNGNDSWLEFTLRPLTDSNGQVVEFQAVGRDITEQKYAREERIELEKMLQQAQKMEAIGTLAGGIAHDFNNILSGIIGYSELAASAISKDSAPWNHIQQVLKAGARARKLVSHILAFSRQETPMRSPVDVAVVMKDCLSLLRATLPTTIEIRQKITAPKTVVLGDSSQIHQVILNLCTNAGQAMESAGGLLELGLSMCDAAPVDVRLPVDPESSFHIVISVRDTGPGIKPGVLARIFDPYFTTKKKGVGTGLGLSVTHSIVKSHGGFIRVDSQPDKGTCFEVYLPAHDSDAGLSAEAQLENVPRGAENVLVVDDEPFIADLTKQMLESLGYTVTAITSSTNALSLFQSDPRKFDLVITDLTMPSMTGIQLSRKLIESRNDLPIILCTGYSDQITKEKVYSMGIMDFIMKPIMFKELAVAVRRALEQKAP